MKVGVFINTRENGAFGSLTLLKEGRTEMAISVAIIPRIFINLSWDGLT